MLLSLSVCLTTDCQSEYVRYRRCGRPAAALECSVPSRSSHRPAIRSLLADRNARAERRAEFRDYLKTKMIFFRGFLNLTQRQTLEEDSPDK